MVKPPKIRHSKSRKEPVTIDLDPAEIVRGEKAKADTANDPGAAKPYQAPAAGAPEAKPAATPQTPSSSAGAFDEPAKEAAKAGEPAAPSSKSQPETSAHGFGRQASPTSASTSASSNAGGKPSAAASSASSSRSDRDRAGSSAAAAPPPSARRRGGVSAIAAGIVGGVIALGIGYGLQAGGLLPGPRGDAPATSEPGAVAADIQALQAEIAALKQQQAAAPLAPAPDPAVGELGGRVDALAASVEQLKAAPASTPAGDPAALDGLNQKIAALEASVARLSSNGGQGALDAVDARFAELEQALATQTAATASANEAQAGLTARLGTIEDRLASLGETVEGQPKMALAIAATALKAAVDRGDPFQAELDTYAAVAPEAAGIEALRPLAAEGVATRGAIESEVEAAAMAMIDAARPVDPNAGLVDRLVSSAQSLVSVRPIGAVEGEGVPAIAARIEAAIKADDFAKAVAEYGTLPEPAKAAGADFIARVEARRQADSLVETALSGALQPAEDAAPAATPAPPAASGG